MRAYDTKELGFLIGRKMDCTWQQGNRDTATLIPGPGYMGYGRETHEGKRTASEGQCTWVSATTLWRLRATQKTPPCLAQSQTYNRASTNTWVLTKRRLKILSIPQTDSLDRRL